MIFVNFKTYKEGTGDLGMDLLSIIQEVAHEEDTKVIPVVQATDIRQAIASTDLEVWVQHVDAYEFGAHTGVILPEAVKEDGAMGTFLNHSEHKFADFGSLEKANQRALALGLKTLIFAANIEELKKIIGFRPTLIAYEPPELVGSKTTSVAKARPEVIKKAVEIAHKARLPLIVGAGIKSQEDVRVSLRLGAMGVAVASDIVTSKNPRKEILDLVEGFS